VADDPAAQARTAPGRFRTERSLTNDDRHESPTVSGVTVTVIVVP
jgi:hypothetical protein